MPDITLNISYKDVGNIWYVTEHRLERDVLTRGSGIAVKYVTQKMRKEPQKAKDIPVAAAGPAPDVALIWDLPEEKRMHV